MTQSICQSHLFCILILFTVKTCPALTVAHSTRIPASEPYNYNTQITYTCENGYESTGGSLQRTCLSSGSWSGDDPVCTGKFL